MRLKPEQFNSTPEYKQALQELIKYEIQALVERLADTGEESVFITACQGESTCTTFGSSQGELFLSVQRDLGNRFLNYCSGNADSSHQFAMGKGSPHNVLKTTHGREAEASGTQQTPALQDKQGTSMAVLSTYTASESLNTEGVREVHQDKLLYRSKPPAVNPGTSETEDSLQESDMVHDLSMAGNPIAGIKEPISVPVPLVDLYNKPPIKQPTYKTVEISDMSASERPDSTSSAASTDGSQSQSNLQCSICNKSFKSYDSFSQHVRFHAVKSYKCGICGKMSYTKKSYERHLRIHTKNKPYVCGICDKAFSDSSSWKRHKERHSEIRPFTCQVCGKAFYEKYSLRVHQTSHFLTQRADKSVDSSSGFYCHSCQKVFPTQTALRKHLLMHTTKKYSCEFCNKRFAAKFSYNRHRRIHTGEKPYRCQTCNKPFSDGSAWSKHVRTHTGIKPYTCDTCGKAFFDKTTCRVHQKTHERKGERYSTDKVAYQLTDSDSMFMGNLGMIMEEKDENLFDDKDYDNADPLQSEFERTLLGSHSDVLEFTENTDFLSQDQKSTEDTTFSAISPILEGVDLTEKFAEDFDHMHLPLSKPQKLDMFPASYTEAPVMEKDIDIPVAPEKAGKSVDEMGVVSKEFKESTKQRASETKATCSIGNIQYLVSKTAQEKSKSLTLTSLILKCQKCFKIFKTEEELRQHQQFQCLLKFNKCRFCGKRLATKQSLERHVRIHTGEKPFKCTVCQKTFADNSFCIKHMRQHFSDGEKGTATETLTASECITPDQELFQCHYCGEMFTSQESCQSHVCGHKLGDKAFTDLSIEPAVVEKESTSKRDSLTLLRGSPRESTPIVLSPDGYAPTEPILTSHSAIISTSVTAETSIQPSPTSSLLSYGLSSQASNIVPAKASASFTPSLETCKAEHRCTICEKTFKSKGVLNQHFLFHKERRYSCQYCPKKFHNKYGFDRHVRIHTGEKPYSCPVCRKAFSDNSACTKHVRLCTTNRISGSQ